MTSIPASRSARAMIFAPRSCPSRPGLATTTRIFFVLDGALIARAVYVSAIGGGSAHAQRHRHVRLVDRADDLVGPAYAHPAAERAVLLVGRAELPRPPGDGDVVQVAADPAPRHLRALADADRRRIAPADEVV